MKTLFCNFSHFFKSYMTVFQKHKGLSVCCFVFLIFKAKREVDASLFLNPVHNQGTSLQLVQLV